MQKKKKSILDSVIGKLFCMSGTIGDIFDDSFYEIYLYSLNISEGNGICELRHAACMKHNGISEV